MAELRWGAATHEGQLRNQNEDHHHAGEGLFVVADGMGGHLAGEVASEMAVDRLRANLSDRADAPVLDDVVAAIAEANAEIYDGSIRNADQAGMGTTVTAMAVIADPHDGEVFGIANVGDSRGYVLRHGRLRQVTIDHSFVQELVAEGAITRDEARYHPRRNIVTRALGIEPSVRVDSWTMPIFRGDRFVLCSDGLVDEVPDEEIAAVILEHHDDPDAAAQALVDAANAAGGRDNITVVVLDVLDGDDPPDPTVEFDVLPLWADDDGDDTQETHVVADPLPEDEDTSGDDDTADDEPRLPASGPAKPHTADVRTADDADPAGLTGGRAKRSKGAGLFRFVVILGFAAVAILGFAILAAWARSGYYVAFDEDDRVAIYQGREDGFLWFQPTVEAFGQFTREQLTSNSVDLVEDRVHFESQDSAARFVAERLEPRDASLLVPGNGDDDNGDETGTTGTTDPGDDGG